jgi:hypothetical protein
MFDRQMALLNWNRLIKTLIGRMGGIRDCRSLNDIGLRGALASPSMGNREFWRIWGEKCSSPILSGSKK